MSRGDQSLGHEHPCNFSKFGYILPSQKNSPKFSFSVVFFCLKKGEHIQPPPLLLLHIRYKDDKITSKVRLHKENRFIEKKKKRRTYLAYKSRTLRILYVINTNRSVFYVHKRRHFYT